MAELKTTPNDGSVRDFLNALDDDRKREDSFRLLEMMSAITDAPPKLWGPSIIGFGTYRYVYESGRDGDWFQVGFSPRKAALTLYIMSGFSRCGELLERLGKYKTGKSCLYIKRLSDVDEAVLEELIRASVAHVTKSAS